MLKELKKIDWTLSFAAVILTAIGITSIYFSLQSKDSLLLFEKQLLFFVIGFFLMIITALYFDLRYIRQNSLLILILYGICIASLGLLFVFGLKIKGMTGWFPIFGTTIQPVEFLKLVLAILLGKYFTIRHIEMYQVRHLLVSGMYVLIPSILIFFQPDLGSIIILWSIWLGIILIAEVKLKHLAAIFVLGIILSVFAWNFLLHDYQKERIVSFVNPKLNPSGQSYQVNQSMIAIGSGGILGKGFQNSTQANYGFLPEAQTDFVFSAIAEQTGTLGVIFVFTLYGLIFWRISKIASNASNTFYSLTAVALGVMIFSQLFINVGMNIRILPVIGVTIPFLSYGGSSLISMFLALGILQNIKINSSKGYLEN